MREMGNTKSNQIYNPRPVAAPTNSEESSAMSSFIRNKYEYKKYAQAVKPPLPQRTPSAQAMAPSASPPLPRRPSASQRSMPVQKAAPSQSASASFDLIDMSDGDAPASNAQTPLQLPPMQYSYQAPSAQMASMASPVYPLTSPNPYQQSTNPYFAMQQTSPYAQSNTNPFNVMQQQQQQQQAQSPYGVPQYQQQQQPPQSYWTAQ